MTEMSADCLSCRIAAREVTAHILYGIPRLAFLFTGSDLPHVHAHVVPMHENTDITSRLYIAQEQLTF
jgi:histidine triad (HIT) family protein